MRRPRVVDPRKRRTLVMAIILPVALIWHARILIRSAAARLIPALLQFGVGSGQGGRARKWYPATYPGWLSPDAERKSDAALSAAATSRRIRKRADDYEKSAAAVAVSAGLIIVRATPVVTSLVSVADPVPNRDD